MNKLESFDAELEDDVQILEDTNPTTKLERRRRIEEMHEEKRLREELGDYDFLL